MCARRPQWMAEELAGNLGTVQGVLTGRAMPVRDCYRVRRFSPNQPRPVIVCFLMADAKVAILCAKGVLYRPKCPKALHSIHVYHDLSMQELSWKLQLQKAHDTFRAFGICVWHKGHRLFALLEGIWTEVYPPSAFVL